MKIDRDKLEKAFQKAFQLDITNWSAVGILQYISSGAGLQRLIDPRERLKIPVFDEIIDAQKNKESLILVSGDQELDLSEVQSQGEPNWNTANPRPRRIRPRWPNQPVRVTKFTDWASQVAYLKENPYPIPETGLTRIVYDELVRAGLREKKGVTKEHLLAVIRRHVPKKNPLKLQTNLDNLVPCRFRSRFGIHVWRFKEAKGHPYLFMIVGDGKTPQPEESKVKYTEIVTDGVTESGRIIKRRGTYKRKDK